MDSNGSWGIRGLLTRYGARLFGALCGLTVGILFLTIGFFKTLLLCFLTVMGWLLGARMDARWSSRMKAALRRLIGDSGEE